MQYTCNNFVIVIAILVTYIFKYFDVLATLHYLYVNAIMFGWLSGPEAMPLRLIVNMS